MTRLLKKDLRLVSDALFPWALIVIGFTIFGVLLVQLPATIVPFELTRFTVADVLQVTAGLATLSAIALGSWCAAAVSQGDRTHGSEHLMTALPVRGWRRTLSKFAALLVGVATPATVVVGCVLMQPGSDDTSTEVAFPAGFWLIAGGIVAAPVGTGLGLAVSPLVRGSFRVVALSLLLGLGAGLIGIAASWVSFDRASAEFVAFWQSRGGDAAVQALPLDSSRAFAATVAAVAAVAVVSAVGLITGSITLARAVGTRSVVAALGVGMALAFAAGAKLTVLTFGLDPSFIRTMEWERWNAHEASDQQLIWFLGGGPAEYRIVFALGAWSPGILGARLPGISDAGSPYTMDAFFDEIADRVVRLDSLQRRTDALTAAASESNAPGADGVRLRILEKLPFGEESVAMAVHAATKFPRYRRKYLYWLVHAARPLEPLDEAWNQSAPLFGARNQPDRFHVLVADTLRDLWIHHPPERGAIEVLLSEMGAASSVDPPDPSLWLKKEAPSSELP